MAPSENQGILYRSIMHLTVSSLPVHFLIDFATTDLGAMYIDIFLGMVAIAGLAVGGILVYNYYAPKYGYSPLPMFQSPPRYPGGRGGRGMDGRRGDGGRGGRGGQLLKEASFQTIDSMDSSSDKWGTPQRMPPQKGGKGSGSKGNERYGAPQRQGSYRNVDKTGSRAVRNPQRQGYSTSRMPLQREDSGRFHINEIKNGGYYTNKERKQEYV